jgi:hypothetical protein
MNETIVFVDNFGIEGKIIYEIEKNRIIVCEMSKSAHLTEVLAKVE